MLLAQTKEREYRFRLALRMGLPIFLLSITFVWYTLTNSLEKVDASFYFITVLLLTLNIYFIFFLIYNSFDVHITENISQTFTRDYLYAYINKEIQKHEKYTLILLSVDNLDAINTRYGLKNGDKVLLKVAQHISEYFEEKKMSHFPMGHIKGGDFVLGMKGSREDYATVLELLCLKSSEFKVDDIEVHISSALIDTEYSKNVDYMIENLFEIQSKNKNNKSLKSHVSIDPNTLESYVIRAIENKSVSIMAQNVYKNSEIAFRECFVRLKTEDGMVLHPKSYMKTIHTLGLSAEYDYLSLQKLILHCLEGDKGLVSISIHPTSLRNHSFLAKVKNLLAENKQAKNRIIFMTSEIEYYSPIDRYNTTLQSLRREGVQIAIDRLGSLHTSFLYLRDLDVDIVRFDSFYSKEHTKDTTKILEGLHTTAHLSGVKTWVRMLESEKLKRMCEDIKIDYLQGNALHTLEKIYED